MMSGGREEFFELSAAVLSASIGEPNAMERSQASGGNSLFESHSNFRVMRQIVELFQRW
jgi:hypothetical protein